MSVVALDRRFSEWDQTERPDLELLLAMGIDGGELTWEDLMKKCRIIIRAEAGSGKSTEMKEQARLAREILPSRPI